MASRRRTSQQILAELKAEDDGLFTRPIGIWSLEKLATLLLYFGAFSNACRSAGGGYYVDGLSGPGVCRIKGAKQPPYRVWGSPLLALRTRPEFLRCILLDKNARTVEVLRARVAAYGERAGVYVGDVNLELARLIQEQVPRRAPCFCLFDPQGTELSWATISSVALTPGRTRKPELLILFPLRMGLLRLLTTKTRITPERRERLDSTFPSREWWTTYVARLEGEIDPARAKSSYLDLYCGGIKALGYRWVRSKPIKAPLGPAMGRQEMYDLVFATDHPTGDKIMQDVFQRPYALDFPVSEQPPLFEQ